MLILVANAEAVVYENHKVKSLYLGGLKRGGKVYTKIIADASSAT